MDETQYPSFFVWLEWSTFRDKYQLSEVKLDLGRLGHTHRGSRLPYAPILA